MKKVISILILFIFMLQALPVSFWLNSITKNYYAIELNGGMDKEEKTDAEKESKEKIYLEKYTHFFGLIFINKNPKMLTAENAVILHHAEVFAPPPNING